MQGLILVPGHGVCLDPDAPEALGSWVGVPPHPEEPALYVAHARAGVERAAAEPGSLLVFSGGATRAAAGPRSEAASYRDVAAAAGWWGHPEVAARVALEEFARDSLENLAFALALHRCVRGRDPDAVRVLGFAFKAERFRLHASALGWSGPFEALGVNDPPEREGIRARSLAGEARKRAALESDPLLTGPTWRAQRAERDPFGRRPDYAQRAPELAPFLADLAAGRPVRAPWEPGPGRKTPGSG